MKWLRRRSAVVVEQTHTDPPRVGISCVIATHGGPEWAELAQQRALPSTVDQGFVDVVLVHEPDGTVATARNEGARIAKGRWLCFLDADDELAPGFVTAVVAAMGDDPDVGFDPRIYTPSVQYVRGKRRQDPKIWPRVELQNNNWLVIGTIVDRSMFLSVGGFREYGWSEDWALWSMCDRAGATVIEVPEAVYIAHTSPASRNRSPSRQTRLYWHQRIGHDIWPEHYDALTDEEDRRRTLRSKGIRTQ